MTDKIVKYNITDAAIQEMNELYATLTIDDLNDQEQFDSVHTALKIVKSKMVEVEKERKVLKADALAYGRRVDGEAKRISNLLLPIKTHLLTEEKKVTDEKDRLKKEEERLERENIESRIKILMEHEKVISYMEVATMTDTEFYGVLETAKNEFETKQIVKAEEEASLREENRRLEQTRLEQEKMAAELKTKQDKLDADQKFIDDAKAKIKADEEAKARKEAEEIAAKEAAKKAEEDKRQRIKDDEERAKEKAKAEVERKARAEALKPDKERLYMFLGHVWAECEKYNYDLSDPHSKAIYRAIIDLFDKTIKESKALIEDRM